jgi:hypothetical protein
MGKEFLNQTLGDGRMAQVVGACLAANKDRTRQMELYPVNKLSTAKEHSSLREDNLKDSR